MTAHILLESDSSEAGPNRIYQAITESYLEPAPAVIIINTIFADTFSARIHQIDWIIPELAVGIQVLRVAIV
jgi:hypothetical protein